MNIWQKLALIGALGALGSLARYGLTLALQTLSKDTGFPWGTLACNVLGCLLFGLIWSLAESRQLISSESRAIVLTGFMGAFTTFSTYAFETGQLMRDNEWLLAGGNLLGSTALGLAAIFAGFALGRLI